MKFLHSPKDDNSVFHKGEVFAQNTLGLASTIAKNTQGFIRPFMPKQHRDFFASGPLMMIGLLDATGHPVALPIWGDEGFVQSPSETRLVISLAPSSKHLIETQLDLDCHQGSKFGLVGVELATRRRNRLNGVISHHCDELFQLDVEQSFGNCPQYIHKRNTLVEQQATECSVATFSQLEYRYGLPNDVSSTITNADTFYIASRHNRLGNHAKEGIDVSHRGGKPGFIHVENNQLLIPDFSGNKFFNTLGNIQLDSRVGLCFIDDITGTLYILKGNAEILWDTATLPNYEGAERFLRIDVNHTYIVRGTYPYRHTISEYSKSIERTGSWSAL